MSNYLDLSPGGDINMVNAGRTVLTTAGRFVTGLPSSYDYVGSLALTFPDFTKSWAYNWRWSVVDNGPSGSGRAYNRGNKAAAWITAPKQDWSLTTVIAAAPSTLINLMALKVRVNRTTAPTKTWNGDTVGIRPLVNTYIPLTGTILLEARPGFARAVSFYIDPSTHNFVAFQQQSVSVEPGGYNHAFGDTTTGGTGPAGNVKSGGQWTTGTGVNPGFLAYTDVGMQTQDNDSVTTASTPIQPGFQTTCLIGGTHEASHADTTNYKSVYNFDIIGKYARAA